MGSLQSRAFLAIPGPTPVPDAVLEAVARHPIGHRTPAFSQSLIAAKDELQRLGETENDVFILTASGTGAMEAAISNIVNPGDVVISLVCGNFSERWAKIAEAFGAKVERMTVEPGQKNSVEELKNRLSADKEKNIKAVTITHNETSTGVMNDLEEIVAAVRQHGAISIVDAVTSFGAYPIAIDKIGVDILVTGSQKALMLPPGLAVIFFSDKAWLVSANCKTPRFYLDLRKYKKAMEEESTPFTPNVSLVAGLEVSLSMMKEEGASAIFARHERMKMALRAGLKAMDLELFVSDESIASPTITAILPPKNISPNDIRKGLKTRFNIFVADGQDSLKGKIFRIGHMGYVFDRDILMVLSALEAVLTDLGHKCQSGAAVQAAIAASK